VTFRAKSVLVVGGSGFIGTELLRTLTNDGVQEITSADLLPPRERLSKVKYVIADVREEIALRCEPEIVFNLAAVHRTPGHPDAEYYDTNVTGALRVTEFCEKVGSHTIVFTSSISVYGPSESPITEASSISPNSAYGKSKAMAESIHRDWKHHDKSRKLVIVRPAVVFGFGEGGNFERLYRGIRSRYFVFPGRQDTVKACGYVSELVRSLDWALHEPDDELLFNFAYPDRYTIKEIVRAIAQHGGLKEPRISVPPAVISSIQKIGRQDVGVLARIKKLTVSTNVYPGLLVERKYIFETDLDSGVAAWMSIVASRENSDQKSDFIKVGKFSSVRRFISKISRLAHPTNVETNNYKPMNQIRESRRIVVHDYCGHPFQVQLSRSLAKRGNLVLHLYCPSVSSPRGEVELRSDDPEGLAIEAVLLDREFDKYHPLNRLRQERKYGRTLARRIDLFRPDVVISGNTPLLSQRAIQRLCRRTGVNFVFWLQDLIGVGIRNVMVRRKSILGVVASQAFVSLEKRLLRSSQAVVAISEDFRELLVGSYGIEEQRISVIENWASLDEISLRPHENRWKADLGLAEQKIILYAGTLGMKHRPELLLQLAIALATRPDVSVIVASEGLGADWLREQKTFLRLENLTIMGFQPYEDLPDMLGAADILTVVLEPDAGIFSVPSKVLTYLCAGRAILAAIPSENLAARIIERSNAGVVVTPSDSLSFVNQANNLLENAQMRDEMGLQGRQFAEKTFDIERITDQFEGVFDSHQDPAHPISIVRQVIEAETED